MLINRRDLEYILKVMDKFKLSEPWNGVEIDYKEQTAGYDLSIGFGDSINGILCHVTVPIDADMFGDE